MRAKKQFWTYIDIFHNVVFEYTSGHSREEPLAFLGDYAGYLQADAYQGCDAFFARRRAQEAPVARTPGGSSLTPKAVIRSVPSRCRC